MEASNDVGDALRRFYDRLTAGDADSFNVLVSSEPDATVVAPSGELDMATAPLLVRALTGVELPRVNTDHGFGRIRWLVRGQGPGT